MSVRLCIGDYAKNGYEPEKMGIRVFSLEELCFFIRENAGILDDGLVDASLGEWLEKECGLKDLGEEIKRAAHRKISLKSFVSIILNFAAFYPPQVNHEIENAINQNNHLTIYEKKKRKADSLLKRGQYGLAGREYMKVLEILPEKNGVLRGEIYHACGVCLARMFYFRQAGEYFLKAHTLTGRIASYKQYLWTKRLSMTEEEYLEFLKEHEEAYEDSLEMEHYLEQVEEQWPHSQEALLLSCIREEKETKNVLAYQEKINQRVEYLKDSYREMVYQPK